MNNLFRADLHCHSTCSDGTYSPRELLDYAGQLGLSGLSITDHDTVEAYTVLAPLPQTLVVGAEFSATEEGNSVHILGYGFKADHPAIAGLCNRHRERRRQRNLAILKLLTEHQMPITEDELGGEGSVGRPHIAQAMLAHGYVSTIKEAFDKYIADGKPCYSRGEPVTVDETIAAIQLAGGLAVIAHPHLIKNEKLILRLLRKPFNGIEAYYAKFPPSQEQRWKKTGQERGWLVTGGSDFHGSVKPDIPLGCSWVGEEVFRALLALSMENNGGLY